MPAYLDLLLTFSINDNVRDMKHSSFREQTSLGKPQASIVSSSLGRSGQHFQICYTLKGAVFKDVLDVSQEEWTIRQAAVHHQFDVVNGNALWIVTQSGEQLQKMFKDMTEHNEFDGDRSFGTLEDCFRSSFSTHLLSCAWSSQNWRRYLRWIENEMDKSVSREKGFSVLN